MAGASRTEPTPCFARVPFQPVPRPGGQAGRQEGKGVVGGQDQHPTHCTPNAAHAPAHIKQEGWEQAALAGPLALNLVANYALSIISM